MKTKPAPTSTSTQPPLLASYTTEFEQWMRNSARCRNSADPDDICQEIRFGLWEIRDVPATREDARRIFLRLVNIHELRARRQVLRQGALMERPEELAASIESETERTLALFEALEQLDDHQRWLVKQCKIDGRKHADVAKQLGVSEETVRNRIWRAMAQLLAILDESGNRKKTQRGAVIAPLAFEFTDTQRAAFNAIWQAEGCVPTFAGGPPGPPGPPDTPPVTVGPLVSGACGSAVSAVKVALLVVLLLLVPTSIIAIYYFWDPAPVRTANKVLYVPPAPEIEDVDQVAPLYPHAGPPVDQAVPLPPPTRQDTVQVLPTSTSGGVRTPSASSSGTSAHATEPRNSIDPDEIERARQQIPRFLPSRH